MKHHFLIDEPTPEERLAQMTEEEKQEHYLGQRYYEKETGAGKRVFTMKAARKYDYNSVRAIFRYIIYSGKLDYYETEKDIISFRNVMRVLEEKTPPPTEEEMKRLEKVYERWKQRCEERRQMWEEEEE